MMIAPVVAILLLLFGVCSYAELQPPAPSRGETETHQVKDADHPQITANTLSHAPPENCPSCGVLTKPDWYLVLITGILAFVTYRLVVQTRRLVDETSLASKRQATETQDALDISRQAAEAAQKSAQVLPNIERAYLFAEVGNVDEAFPVHLGFILKISNEGKTPAIVTQIAVGLIEGSDCLGNIKKTRDINIDKGGVIRGGGLYTETINFDWGSWAANNSKGRRILMPNTAPDLVLFGFITYKDIFKDDHTLRFCWHHDANATNKSVYFSQCNNNNANNYD